MVLTVACERIYRRRTCNTAKRRIEPIIYHDSDSHCPVSGPDFQPVQVYFDDCDKIYLSFLKDVY
jgi:NADPH-dependent 7-cyano-7-deazaguanine reductase QueF